MMTTMFRRWAARTTDHCGVLFWLYRRLHDPINPIPVPSADSPPLHPRPLKPLTGHPSLEAENPPLFEGVLRRLVSCNHSSRIPTSTNIELSEFTLKVRMGGG